VRWKVCEPAMPFSPDPVIPVSDPRFGPGSAGFGFVISWATNVPVVVEASRGPAAPIWVPVATHPLTDGSVYFSDLDWINHPARFYRVKGQ
jgi:hypothetical protein